MDNPRLFLNTRELCRALRARHSGHVRSCLTSLTVILMYFFFFFFFWSRIMSFNLFRLLLRPVDLAKMLFCRTFPLLFLLDLRRRLAVVYRRFELPDRRRSRRVLLHRRRSTLRNQATVPANPSKIDYCCQRHENDDTFQLTSASRCSSVSDSRPSSWRPTSRNIRSASVVDEKSDNIAAM